MEAKNKSEARFSFIQGGYVEDAEQQGANFRLRLFFGFMMNMNLPYNYKCIASVQI